MPNFFDFFRRERAVLEEEVEIIDLVDWLRKRIDAEFEEVYMEGEAILRRLEASRVAVKTAAEGFVNTEIKIGELDHQLLPTIRNSKESIAAKALTTVSKTDVSPGQGFEDLMEANRTVTQSLSQMDQTLKTHGRVVYTALDKEIRPLLSALKQMRREATGLSKLIEKHIEKASATKTMLEDAKRLLELNAEIVSAHNAVEDAKKGSEETEKSVRNIKRNLEDIIHSKNYEESQHAMEQEKRLRFEMRKKMADFNTSFSKLRKPLEKYSYTAQLDKESKQWLKRYVESPAETLKEDKGLLLEGLLLNMKAYVNDGRVTVKDSSKILRRIEEITSNLANHRKTLVKTKDDLSKIRETLNGSPIMEAEAVQKVLEEKRQSKEDQKTFIKKKRADVEQTTKMMDNLLAKIKRDTEETFGTKLKIVGLAGR
jgi:myosin heavy subunit